MTSVHLRLLALSSVALVSGCGLVAPGACTTDFRFGLVVYVQDSVTGAWAASGARLLTEDAKGVADAGDQYFSAFPADRPELDPQPLLGAGERAGTYRVTVRKAGYADWVRTGVRVTEDECHVRQVELLARLKPAR